MFGVDSGELFLIVLVAVVVIGPKDLPRVMRTIGHWVGRARGMANQFRVGVDQMVRDSEIADLEKKWREQNDAIMQAHPMAAPAEPSFSPPADAPRVDAWSLDKAEAGGPDAPVMKPLGRAAPQPPFGPAAARPTPPKLDKESGRPAQIGLAKPAPAAPDVPAAPAPKRRAPRTSPGLRP